MKGVQSLFRCVEKSDLAIYGYSGSIRGQSITLDIVKCTDDDEVECKSDE